MSYREGSRETHHQNIGHATVQLNQDFVPACSDGVASGLGLLADGSAKVGPACIFQQHARHRRQFADFLLYYDEPCIVGEEIASPTLWPGQVSFRVAL